MFNMPQTGKPLFNDPTLQDTFENLSDQGGDVVEGLRDLVTNSDSNNGNGDSALPAGGQGIEQLGGQKTDGPAKQLQQAQQQGLTPEQLAEKRAEEKKKIDFYQMQAEGWKEHQLQAIKEEEQKKQQAAEEERRKKEQGIIELREEEAKTTALSPQKAKGPTGPGSAFIPYQAKTSMGTRELPKTPTN